MVFANAAQNGVTSAQDFSEWDDFVLFQKLKEEGKLTLRITEWLPFVLPLKDLETMRAAGGRTDPWLRTGALKAFVDGAMGSRTAAMLAPYSDDPSTSGILTNDPEKLRTMAIERDKAGFQLAFHAIGDRANHEVLNAYEQLRAYEKKKGLPALRRGFCALCKTQRYRFHAAIPPNNRHALGR
jgi:predicted amidohydrolase YtcJ